MKSGGEYYLYDIIHSFLEYTFGNLSESELLSRLLQRDDVRYSRGSMRSEVMFSSFSIKGTTEIVIAVFTIVPVEHSA